MSTKDFQLLNKLGEGAFSSVWKVKRLSDGQEYAMKKVKLSPLSEKEKQNALNEVRILASIKHPCIIGYKEAFFEDNPLSLCIVMENAGGGDILKKISQHEKSRTFFKEEDIWRYAVQMIMGLKALHDRKILHRDLKCANVFLSTDNKTAKLGDLNVSKVAKNNLVYTQTGTPYYASPEVWRDQPYDLKSDIWSLGCVIYEMCALKPPFRANDMQGLFKKIQRGVFDRIPSNYSIDLYNLISICLQVKPAQRPNCDQLLSHAIIQKNGGKFIQDIADVPGMDELNDLLGTIRLPANIKQLAQKLPKANYEQDPLPSELERGRAVNPEPDQKPVEIKRPTSQNAPINRNVIRVRESQSRESRISHMLKAQQQAVNPIPPKESEREYLIRMQREYLDRAKAIKPTELGKDQKQGENAGLQRSPNYRVLSGRRVLEEQKEPTIVKVDASALPAIRPKDRRLEEAGERVLSNKQEYLINKYQNQNNISVEEKKVLLPRMASENDHILMRRADHLLDKYHAIDNAKKDAVIRGAGNGQRREPGDILERYANVLNNKDVPIIRPKENLPYTPRINNGQNKENYSNNANLIRPQAHMKVNNRPMWWG